MRKYSVIALFITSAFATPLCAADDNGREIVVIGQSLKDTEKALADCIARQCPPDEEIRAALAHAENQFIGGDYRAAKSTLNKTSGRNRKHGENYPIEVSDLFRASSRIAEHLGEGKQFQLAVLDMRDILKNGLPDNDARVMVAQVEVGDSRAKLGYPDEALRIYRDVSKKAQLAGHSRVAAFAQMRQHLLTYSLGENLSDAGSKREGREGLAKLAMAATPGLEDFALVAEVALARIDRKEGKTDSTNAIIERFTQRGGSSHPLLLSSEPIKLVANPRHSADRGSAQNVLGFTPANFEDRWIDVGFWVNGNGLVSDVEVLRSEGDVHWSKLVTDSIKSRIYAPLKAKADDASPAHYMIERYSYTSRYLQDTTGTRISRRDSQPRIERIDITPTN